MEWTITIEGRNEFSVVWRKAVRVDKSWERVFDGDLGLSIEDSKTIMTVPQSAVGFSGLYRLSDLEVNTRDYRGLRVESAADKAGFERFPLALHPISVWEVTSTDNVFSALVGPLTNNHHLQAQTKVVELGPLTAEPLLTLERREVALAVPNTLFGQGFIALKNSKLAPKHEGAFEGSFAPHDVWYFYALVLRDAQKRDLAFKIGYSHDPEKRAAGQRASTVRSPAR